MSISRSAAVLCYMVSGLLSEIRGLRTKPIRDILNYHSEKGSLRTIFGTNVSTEKGPCARVRFFESLDHYISSFHQSPLV